MAEKVGVPLTVEDYFRDLAAMPDREVSEMALHRAGRPVDALDQILALGSTP